MNDGPGFRSDDYPREEPNGGAGKHPKRKLLFRRAADIEPEPVNWLWRNRLALGKLSLLVGDPGLCKSQIGYYATAIITKGGMWCDGARTQSGSVIILSAEDGAADTLRPRLEAAGADLARVHILDAVVENDGKRQTFNLQLDLEQLAAKVVELGDVKMVVVDPLTSYMGDADSIKATPVRSILQPFTDFGEKYNVAILGITHPPKQTATKALYNATGSLAFVAVARILLLAVEDQEIDGRRLFLGVKNNLGPVADGIGYTLADQPISNNIVSTYVAFDSLPVSLNANEALAATTAIVQAGGRNAIADAVEFLRDALANGPALATEITDEAEARDIAARTLKRARKKLDVTAWKTSFNGPWKWSLPGQPTSEKSDEPIAEEEPRMI